MIDEGSDSPEVDRLINEGSDSPELDRLIDDQTALATAIPVLLFTSPALQADPRSPGGGDGQLVDVDQVAAGLGLDPRAVELFSLEAYELQCALGQAILPPPE